MPYEHDIEKDLLEILKDLIQRGEREIVEFKEANKDYDKNKIGQYFSAISNEANLENQQYGWLIFGVRDKDRKVVGTNYRDASGLDKLKQEISMGTTGGISFMNIYEVYPLVGDAPKRVIMFQIPAAATAIPTGWQDHYYGRNGESLGALSVEELDRIRGQEKRDWSKQILPEATFACLDQEAILLARTKYKERMGQVHIAEEVDQMTDEQFLQKLKLLRDGKITNAAFVLLGNSDFDYLLNTSPKIMWRLYGAGGIDKDYEIFTVPFISVVDKVAAKIRNLTYRYLPNQQTLFPVETKMYDSWLLRELINNCIAHSDYASGGRIYVNEFEDKVKLTNPGTFLPGRIEPVLEPGYNPPFYRNQLLAEVMTKFYMIDTASMGIRKVFRIQKEKYFPLPDYDVSASQVSVTVYGKIINENYTQALFNNPDFTLKTVFLIDRVQKGAPITKEDVKYLRKLRLIEGKMPNIYISASVADTIDEKEQRIKYKAFDDQYYKDMMLTYIKEYGGANKSDIKGLLWNKLSDSLSEKQKDYKVGNLLMGLKKAGKIRNATEQRQNAQWVLCKTENES